MGMFPLELLLCDCNVIEVNKSAGNEFWRRKVRSKITTRIQYKLHPIAYSISVCRSCRFFILIASVVVV